MWLDELTPDATETTVLDRTTIMDRAYVLEKLNETDLVLPTFPVKANRLHRLKTRQRRAWRKGFLAGMLVLTLGSATIATIFAPDESRPTANVASSSTATTSGTPSTTLKAVVPTNPLAAVSPTAGGDVSVPTSTLKHGWKNPEAEVRWVQRRLSLPQTGQFDEATLHTVQAFQKYAELENSGIVGPRTTAALRGLGFKGLGS